MSLLMRFASFLYTPNGRLLDSAVDLTLTVILARNMLMWFQTVLSTGLPLTTDATILFSILHCRTMKPHRHAM